MSKEFIPVSPYKSFTHANLNKSGVVEHQIYINVNRIAFFTYLQFNTNDKNNECYVIKLNNNDTQDLIPTDYIICKEENPDAFHTLTNKF